MIDPVYILKNALEAHIDIHGPIDLLEAAEAVDSPPQMSPYDRIESLIPADSPIMECKTLAELSDYVRDTELIELDRTRLNPVFGVGNPDADLLVIGEAPGADEDKKGEPFVGRAGQLLTEILKAIGFERENVYIANILKSRPPKNRDPLPEEIAAHIPILYRQIGLIRPKLMLCVGRTAGNSLLGRNESLGAMRGEFQDFHGLPVLVTYHPAALLRNSNWKRPTWEDVQLLKKRHDELTGA
ncbi:MAG: uracil-DNA glycosylase family 4 [Rhodothermales bacterium]|jgi:uracil-DNA glycosylase family 4